MQVQFGRVYVFTETVGAGNKPAGWEKPQAFADARRRQGVTAQQGIEFENSHKVYTGQDAGKYLQIRRNREMVGQLLNAVEQNRDALRSPFSGDEYASQLASQLTTMQRAVHDDMDKLHRQAETIYNPEIPSWAVAPHRLLFGKAYEFGYMLDGRFIHDINAARDFAARQQAAGIRAEQGQFTYNNRVFTGKDAERYLDLTQAGKYLTRHMVQLQEKEPSHKDSPMLREVWQSLYDHAVSLRERVTAGYVRLTEKTVRVDTRSGN